MGAILQGPQWLPYVGPLGAVLAALTGGVVALIGGLSGATLTQYLTRKREDRARLLQHKRDVCTGALAAWRDFSMAEREVKVLELLSSNLEERVKSHLIEFEKSETAFREHGAAMDDVNRAIAQRAADHTRNILMKATEASKARQDELFKSLLRRSSAVRALEYWAAMLELTCHASTAKCFRVLCDGPPEERISRLGNFVRTAQEELTKEPTAPDWVPNVDVSDMLS